jgi:hypothetical protein
MLFEFTVLHWHSPGDNAVNHWKPQSREQITQLRFEIITSSVQFYIVTYTDPLSIVYFMWYVVSCDRLNTPTVEGEQLPRLQ